MTMTIVMTIYDDNDVCRIESSKLLLICLGRSDVMNHNMVIITSPHWGVVFGGRVCLFLSNKRLKPLSRNVQNVSAIMPCNFGPTQPFILPRSINESRAALSLHVTGAIWTGERSRDRGSGVLQAKLCECDWAP